MHDFEKTAQEEGAEWHDLQTKRADYFLWLTGPCPSIWFNTPVQPGFQQEALAKPTNMPVEEVDLMVVSALSLVKLRAHYSMKFKPILRPPRLVLPEVVNEDIPEVPADNRHRRKALKVEWIRRFHECRSLEEFRECASRLGYPIDFFSLGGSSGKEWTTADLASPNAVHRRLEILTERYPFVCCFTAASRVIWMKAQPWYTGYKGSDAEIANNVRRTLSEGALGKAHGGADPPKWMSDLALSLFGSPLAELYVYVKEGGEATRSMLDTIVSPHDQHGYPAPRDVWSAKRYHDALKDLVPAIQAALLHGELGTVWSDVGDTGGDGSTTEARKAWCSSLSPSNRRLRTALILGYPPGGSVMVGPTPSLQDLYMTDQAGRRRPARNLMSFLLAEREATDSTALSETVRRFSQWCLEANRAIARDAWPAVLERVRTTGMDD